MRIRFLEMAQIELDEAIEYYNYETAGLGLVIAIANLHRKPDYWKDRI